MTEPAYTEEDLRIAKDFFAYSGSRTCLHCGHDAVATDVAEKELAAEFANIRRERDGALVAAAYVACANVLANEIRLRESTEHGLDHMRPISELETDIRSLTLADAAQELERLKAEAEREGLVKLRDYFSASHESTLKVGDYGAAYMKLWVELNERIADLSQPKETP